MAAPISTNNVCSDDARPVTYHPNVWSDYFLRYTSELTEISVAKKEEHERQKEAIRNLLLQTRDDSTLKLELVDAIQRLGIGYHFEEEIHNSLRNIYDTNPIYNAEDDNLRVAALRFRLIRQQGFPAPCDVFRKFVDEEGEFKSWVSNDVEGLLNLYEASNFAVHGEEILEKALEFCSLRLEFLTQGMTNSLSMRVKEALKIPISKTLTRLGARKFMSMYQEDESHNETLLNFAKLDFNLVQKIHQKELNQITRWWKELDFGKNLPFARDRPVECYFWIVGVYFEPRYGIARTLLTKIIYLASVLDDIYDVYGTLAELTIFTQIIRRWDSDAMDQLPPYMRIYCKALFDVYVEMEEEMGKIRKSYAVEYAKKEMKRLAEMYFQEAQWAFSKYKPTMKEYLKVALISSGYMMMTINSLTTIEDLITEEEFNWILSEPRILRASLTITRLMDDLAGYGTEGKMSAVHYYMAENGVSEGEAFKEVSGIIKSAWKDVNAECVEPRAASTTILRCVVDFTRVIVLLYSDEDAYGNSQTKTKDLIKSVLVDPLII
uniref:Beta-caryophyllene synthase n=1 Tax=Lavandula angustifolia TaxID=39329 RepID=CARS_LAVAN|nr:RecName: Full=Beta-caryophyllene synthase; Short=LaCARS; AltName: Full=(-)-beta-caryophyllene synthase [Lavandula angustifolia]AGL98419.1 B-caryophyllene synthase [Lavandula angustifolia]